MSFEISGISNATVKQKMPQVATFHGKSWPAEACTENYKFLQTSGRGGNLVLSIVRGRAML